MQAVIIMGSKSDLDHGNKIKGQLDAFGIRSTIRVGSAHKSVKHLFGILDEYAAADEPTVLITVAGRSNALSGMVDANCPLPVIACPPVSSTFGGADIYSSLRMPSGVAPLLVLDPKGAALAAAKILSLGDKELAKKVAAYQAGMIQDVVDADASLH